MKNIRGFISAILGGFAVSIGCTAYLLLKNESPLIAALMFGTGFLAAVVFGLKLYTDKSGYLFTHGKLERNIVKIIATMLGNIIGAFICGFAVSSRVYQNAYSALKTCITGSFVDLLIGSFICGILIYIGIHGYRKAGGFTGCLLLFTSTTMIMLCDFDYALFNIFTVSASFKNLDYITSNIFNIVIAVFIAAIGNAIGAILFATLCKIKDEKDDDNHHHHHHHRHKHKHHSSKKETKEVSKETIEEAGF